MAPRRADGRTMIEVGVVGVGGQDRPNQIAAQPSEQFRPSECALSPLLSRITNFFLRPAPTYFVGMNKSKRSEETDLYPWKTTILR